MAYVTPDKLRSLLIGNADGLNDEELQGFIDEWISHLDAVSGGTHTETGFSRTIVRVGANGDAYKTLLLRDGYDETKAADEMIKRATELLAEYDRLTTSPAEEAAESTLRVVPLPW